VYPIIKDERLGNKLGVVASFYVFFKTAFERPFSNKLVHVKVAKAVALVINQT
jgi:hypothetical protein